MNKYCELERTVGSGRYLLQGTIPVFA